MPWTYTFHRQAMLNRTTRILKPIAFRTRFHGETIKMLWLKRSCYDLKRSQRFHAKTIPLQWLKTKCYDLILPLVPSLQKEWGPVYMVFASLGEPDLFWQNMTKASNLWWIITCPWKLQFFSILVCTNPYTFNSCCLLAGALGDASKDGFVLFYWDHLLLVPSTCSAFGFKAWIPPAQACCHVNVGKWW